jgi:hypothetical protein
VLGRIVTILDEPIPQDRNKYAWERFLDALKMSDEVIEGMPERTTIMA